MQDELEHCYMVGEVWISDKERHARYQDLSVERPEMIIVKFNKDYHSFISKEEDHCMRAQIGRAHV